MFVWPAELEFIFCLARLHPKLKQGLPVEARWPLSQSNGSFQVLSYWKRAAKNEWQFAIIRMCNRIGRLAMPR